MVMIFLGLVLNGMMMICGPPWDSTVNMLHTVVIRAPMMCKREFCFSFQTQRVTLGRPSLALPLAPKWHDGLALHYLLVSSA
jgi:hypothetical protein